MNPTTLTSFIGMDEIKIPNGTFLSDHIDRLPHGIIDKAAPGMGATTLELNSPRHSIIVEPTKVLAFNKAISSGGLYIGSKMFEGDKDTSSKQIVAYMRNRLKEEKHIKLLVVADSFWKVISALEQIDLKREDFFLMFDEIDTYQIDSSYRNKLESVVDYYFEFPEENRCMVSATILEFSDPRLNLSEKKTIISFKSKRKRNINLYRSANPNLLAAQTIEQLLKYDSTKEQIQSTSKIVIAYNSIKDIKELLYILPKEIQNISGVGCSEKSAQQVDSKYVRIEADGILPTQVTFITSAYFNGIDILDRFHLLSVVNKNVNHTMLSEHRFYQIQGRARNKTLSETIVHSHIVEDKVAHPAIEQKRQEYINVAKSALGMLECAHKHFQPSDTSHTILKQIRKHTTEASADNASFVRFVRTDQTNPLEENLNQKIVEAYFNIDSAIERYRIKTQVYKSNQSVKDHLDPNCRIKEEKDIYLEHTELQKEFKKLHQDEKNLSKSEEIEATIEHLSFIDFEHIEQFIKTSTGVSKTLAIRYKELGAYFYKPHIILPMLAEQFEKRKYHNLARSVIFQSIPDKRVFKSDVLKEFRYHQTYSPAEIQFKINKVYQMPQIGISKVTSPKTAVNHLKCYFELSRSRLPGGKKFGYKIVKRNPLNLKYMIKKSYASSKEKDELLARLKVSLFFKDNPDINALFGT